MKALKNDYLLPVYYTGSSSCSSGRWRPYMAKRARDAVDAGTYRDLRLLLPELRRAPFVSTLCCPPKSSLRRCCYLLEGEEA